MAVKFKLIPRKNPQDLAAAPKHYPQAVANGRKDLKALAERISRNTTMGVGDIHGVLLSLEEEIVYALRDGSAVELGNICWLYPAVTGEGVDNPEDFNVISHLKRRRVRVSAKRSLVRQMVDVSVERVE